ncbi:uncharacterized protein VP01_769g10 [Puccinia sorghi]|uniref:Uncharacterized protein n=1 Tax=Puccinia sorghi TaxID=27349 RepID=A0A0L6UBQ1_9BASI|nr:uncharacterized protein VP01_769g10 [Puccinia sorghi]
MDEPRSPNNLTPNASGTRGEVVEIKESDQEMDETPPSSLKKSGVGESLWENFEEGQLEWQHKILSPAPPHHSSSGGSNLDKEGQDEAHGLEQMEQFWHFAAQGEFSSAPLVNTTNYQETLLSKQESISFTQDAWTAPNITAFMAVTAHFIDEDFELHDLTIAVPQVEGNYFYLNSLHVKACSWRGGWFWGSGEGLKYNWALL